MKGTSLGINTNTNFIYVSVKYAINLNYKKV